MDDFLIKLGKNIKKRRELAGLTQAALADLCDMERQNMYRIEKGKTSPTLQTLRLIAKALNLKVRDLLDFE